MLHLNIFCTFVLYMAMIFMKCSSLCESILYKCVCDSNHHFVKCKQL